MCREPESKMASLYYAHLWCVAALMVVFSSALVQADKIPTFSTIPADTTAAVGRSVIIYCHITNVGHYQVFWNIVKNSSSSTTEEFTLGPFTNVHTSYPRYKIVGDLIGEYNLLISDVVKSDAGRYTCLVHDISNDMTSAIEFGARLTVQDNAVDPQMGYPSCERDPIGNSQLVPGKYKKGDVLRLSCTSEGGVPLPKLSWEVVHVNGVKEKLLSSTKVSGDVVMTTTTIELTSQDHQAYYQCTEEHPSMTRPRTCKTPFSGSKSLLDVRFRPEVELTPDVVSIKILETIKVTLSCTAHANPLLYHKPTIILPVNKTGIYPHGESDKTLVEVEMTVDDVGKSFYCRAENEDGVEEDTLEVRRSNSLPAWLVLVIIGCIAVVILFFIVFTSCILCVDRSKYDDARKSTTSSRPTSMRKEDDLNDGMIPIEEFQGGQESSNVQQPHDKTNDFETGEAASPRYQNVNEAFQGDELDPPPPEPNVDTFPIDMS